MDLPPSSPPTSAAVVSAPALAAEAAADFSPSALWDWGNLMDFAIGPDDSLILSWDSPDLPQPPSPRLPLAEVALPVDPTSVAPPMAAGSSSRVRKRDPRLVCANYLAGRVPCACPEVDEKAGEGDEEDEPVLGGRKRVRAGVVSVGVRCQVLGCEADIRELKGYHRRHRVCLRCANASSVMLDGEAKRYCQQCGKFHVLLDFDEGRRSCRRKLERHNKRRRRRPSDSRSVVETEKVSCTEPPEDAFLDTYQTQETLSEFAYKAVDNDVSNKVKDGEMLLDCENGHGSSGCSLPDLELDQSNSPLTYTASADVSVDGRIDNPKSAISSTTCNNKSFYSSMCPTGRISFKLYDWNPAEFPRRLRHQIFQWLASMPVELEGYIRPGCTILTVFIAMPQYMWEKLSQDGALYIKQLISAPESLLLGRGDIFIHLSNMIVHVLKDGTSLVNIKMEVKAPRLHYVHPTYFEAGKAVEFIVCGSNLDQPKLRFLVSFAGKYLACDAYRVTSHGKDKCYGEIAAISGNNGAHEMYMINIIQTHPKVFGPAFIEVENESGISNFISILIGDKQVCSELESIRCPSTRYSSRSGDIGVPSVIFENTACEANVRKQIGISDLLQDIAWVLKEPRKDYNDTFAGSLNAQRLKYMLQFSIQNELASVLKAILKYMGNVIDQAGLKKSENLTADANIEQLLEYMKTAGGFLNLHKERSKLYSGHSNHMETVTVNLKCPTNPVEERRKAYALVSTSAEFSEDSDEHAHLLTKDISCTKNTFLHLGSYWTCKYWATNMFSPPVTRTWPAIFVMTTVIMCFVVCIILLNPNKASDFAVHIRCLLRSSNR